MKPILYLQMKKKISAEVGQLIKIKDVCHLVSDEEDVQSLYELPLKEATPTVDHFLVIRVLDVYRAITKRNRDLDLRQIGPVQTVIEVRKQKARFPHWLFVTAVCLMLFIGSGLTIMNFHTDVSMKEVHQRIFYLITGKEVEKPLILQIPYSLGIGAGMFLFFNHFFKKKFSKEPSPMDLEVFLYQDTIDQYVIDHERKNDHESDPN